jgi:hypothetical protein
MWDHVISQFQRKYCMDANETDPQTLNMVHTIVYKVKHRIEKRIAAATSL